MGDEIRVNLEAAETAIQKLEGVLADWRQKGTAAMEAVHGIMDNQQANATPWLGYVLDDLALWRGAEVTRKAEQFTEDVQSYLKSFGEADRRLAGRVQGGEQDGAAGISL